MIRYSLVVSAALMLFSAPTIAEDTTSKVIVKQKMTYYTISGTNTKEMNLSFVKAIGKLDKNNASKSSIGQITPKVTYQQNNGKCLLTTQSITTKLTARMPKWSGYKKGKKHQREKWDMITGRLNKVQAGYQDIARTYSTKLASKLERTRPAKSCDVLERKVEHLTKKYQARYKRAALKHTKRDLRAAYFDMIHMFQTFDDPNAKYTESSTHRPRRKITHYHLHPDHKKQFNTGKYNSANLQKQSNARHQAFRQRSAARQARTINRVRQLRQRGPRPF